MRQINVLKALTKTHLSNSTDPSALQRAEECLNQLLASQAL